MKQVIINNEEWHYAVNEKGEVFNTETNRELKGTIKHGYRLVQLWKNNKPSMVRVHRLVATAFLPNPNNLPIVHHKDNNRLNNNVDNLEWVSAAENSGYENKLSPNSLLNTPKENDQDIWLPFRDSVYLISQTGKIKNSKTNKLLKGSLDDDGYIRYQLRLSTGRRKFYGHRLVYETFCGNLISGMVVNHKDGIKTNNHVNNLEQITIKKNQEHSRDILKNHQGKTIYQSTLQGDFIRSFSSSRESQRETGLQTLSCLKERTITCGGYFFVYNSEQLKSKMNKFNDHRRYAETRNTLNE